MFQFDACLSDEKVIEDCNNEKKVEVRRLARGLKKKKDPELLDILMKGSEPMVTTDRALPQKHTAHIPDQNPGIVVVAYSKYLDSNRKNLKTMTTEGAAKILEDFKKRIPDWHLLVVVNSVVEITNKEVEISHVERGRLKADLHIEYGDDAKLQSRIMEILLKNARGGTVLPGKTEQGKIESKHCDDKHG